MSNPSKKKGTAAETKVVTYLKDHGVDAERRVLKGSSDEGDIIVRYTGGGGRIIEVKAGKQTENPSRGQVEEWLRQTRVEASNAGLPVGDLVIVRFRRKIEDAEVYSVNVYNKRNETKFTFLDEYAEKIHIYCGE